MKDAFGQNRKRRKSYNIPYHAHFLTFSCYQRQAFLSGDLGPRWFLKCLDKARQDVPFCLWAFVIMPEHVHLVIAPGEDYEMGKILAQIKRPLTAKVIRHVQRVRPAFLERMTERRPGGGVTRRFWQPGGGHDRNLWTPEHIRRAIEYVHANPVRRGLVDAPEDWPWTSFRAWTHGTDEPLPLDLDDLPIVET